MGERYWLDRLYIAPVDSILRASTTRAACDLESLSRSISRFAENPPIGRRDGSLFAPEWGHWVPLFGRKNLHCPEAGREARRRGIDGLESWFRWYCG